MRQYYIKLDTSGCQLYNRVNHKQDLRIQSLVNDTGRNYSLTRMWANAQRDGRPAEYRWRPLFNAAKFG